jgi:hypothetical protein
VPTHDACLVTGYVCLDSQHRGHETYMELGRQLLGLGLPAVSFLDTKIEDCWYLHAADGCSLPEFGNPLKDTLPFLSVQHQKTEWIAEACEHTDAEILVWVDYGILHVQGITPQVVADFFGKVGHARRDRITAPSIWGMPRPSSLQWGRPAWFFAGGVLIVPRQMASALNESVKAVAHNVCEMERKATWEVNTWAAVAAAAPGDFYPYPCDHNATLFTGFHA